MYRDSRVSALLDELLESGGTPEEVCGSCPELLPLVRSRWQRVRAVEAQIGELFPDPTVCGDVTKAAFPTAELPQIAGYDVIVELGRGGMGVVYKAWQPRLNRNVALKMLLGGAYARREDRDRFIREAKSVAGLLHPNIVQIYDVGDSDGRSYFTMEYVEGGSLAQQLGGAAQPARRAAAMLVTLAGAVQAAHQGGVVHRDLKPDNVLLTVHGTPKISDFGLARRLNGEARLTCTGAVLGTPSYMAPEQALGQADTIAPAADIYSLGAILYELLTGRPPFRGKTAAETVQQVISEDPLPPSQLNAKVPRDLETICLKCLHKEPRFRYATAAELAEELDRFLQGEAIAARPERRFMKLIRRARRRPALAATLGASTLLMLALVGRGSMLSSEVAASKQRRAMEQAAVERAVEEDLREMARWQEASAWPRAAATLERARGRLGSRTSELRRRLDQGARDIELAKRLDAIRLARAIRLGQPLAFSRSDEDYEAAFRTAGVGQLDDLPGVVAARVQASHVRNALVAALDDWAGCATDRDRRDWILAVARQADQDTSGWRSRVRDAQIRKNDASLAKLIEDAPVSGQSVPFLLALAEHLKAVGADSIDLLARIQKANPGDFWANLCLAEARMEQNDLPDAVRFYQAAVALRPEAAVVYDNLGLALAMLGRMEDADEQFRRASSLDPTAASAHNNLGVVFSTVGRRDEPIDASTLPRHFSQKVAMLHTTLADELRDKGKFAEAVDRYRQAITLDPKLTSAQYGLRDVLMRQGRMEETRRAWRRAVDADPPDYDAWDGYAELCLFLEQDTEYRRVRRALLERFGTTTDAQTAERTGRACLLLLGSAEEIQQAELLIDRAIAAEKGERAAWAEPYYQFAKGLADYRQGRFEQAISVMGGKAGTAMGPAPRLVRAMGQYRLGHKAEARKTLAAAILSYDWRPDEVDQRDVWIYHVLRREAESLILPNLYTFLAGEYEPGDNEERLALAEGCQYVRHPLAAARLYAESFASDPALADDTRARHRYNAARVASLAASGQADGAKLDAEERARWRAQAYAWLRSDLDARTNVPETTTLADRREATAMLSSWRYDPDLTSLRDEAALERLPLADREQLRRLWDDLGHVLHQMECATH